MKRVLSSILAALLLLSMPFCTSAEDETVLTVKTPGDATISCTGDPAQDAFALAVGYSLAEDCTGLSGYAVTVRWDPTVMKLNTDYREDMDDDEMAGASGCYFNDLYGDGLVISPVGMSAINYRKVFEGEITVVSIGLTDSPYRDATLFVLDMIPLCDDVMTSVSVEVKEIVGLMSSEGMIENYRPKTTVTLQIGELHLRGDADGDGTLSIADAMLIKRHARGQQKLVGSAFYAADINTDKRLDARDYLLLCKELQNS